MFTYTLLGTGTSQGIPVIGCDCAVCASTDVRDKRLRAALLVQSSTTNVVIDTGPDFRQQMLREGISNIDAVLLTHEHKDHIAGMDDVRPINFRYKKDMPVYATEGVQTAVRREFKYAFEAAPYPGVPRFLLHTIDKNSEFTVGDISFRAIEVLHYKLPVLGFRIQNFAYVTDAKTIAKEELDKLIGVKTLIINTLHNYNHIAHLTLEEALVIIDYLKPERTYLTHLGHLCGTHSDFERLLPPNVFLAYDGLKIIC